MSSKGMFLGALAGAGIALGIRQMASAGTQTADREMRSRLLTFLQTHGGGEPPENERYTTQFLVLRAGWEAADSMSPFDLARALGVPVEP